MRRPLVLLLAIATSCSHAIDSPRPTVSGLTPNLVCNAQLTTSVVASGTNLTPLSEKTLTGNEVIELPTVTLADATDLSGMTAMGQTYTVNPNPTDTTFNHVRWESEQQLTFDVFPALMLAPGVYDVTVT